MICSICSSLISPPVPELFALPSVTSDCRPWSAGRSVEICEGCGVMHRVVHSLAQKDFDRVYDDYKSYPEPEGRTQRILEFIADKMPAPKSVLDIGCGEGHGLKALEKFYPQSAIVGYEPHSTNPAVMNTRPTLKYDLITLFHVLEHVEDIHEMLAYVKSALNDGGHVLIQVPYTMMWPFDLVLADHWWHFNMRALKKLLNECGFFIKYIGNDIIKKEITILAFNSELLGGVIVTDSAKSDPISWLLHYKSFLDNINEHVVVFGTGPAAAWAGHILGDKVICYCDDDESRGKEGSGKTFNGKSVVSPSYFKKEVNMGFVAPFPDWQLEGIKAWHPELRFL